MEGRSPRKCYVRVRVGLPLALFLSCTYSTYLVKKENIGP